MVRKKSGKSVGLVDDLIGSGPSVREQIESEFSEAEVLKMIRKLKAKGDERGTPGANALIQALKLVDRYAPPPKRTIKVSFSPEATKPKEAKND